MAPRLLPSRGRVVPILVVLVLLGSAVSLALALTRPDPRPPSDLPGAGVGPYEVARLAGPGGPAVEAMARLLPRALGYDFRALDDGLAQATASMTDEFAARFTRSFDDAVRPLAERRRAVVEARVRAAGQVRLLDGGGVLGLAYVDQVLVQGARLPSGAPPRVLHRYRVLVRLVEDGTDWRIAGISPV